MPSTMRPAVSRWLRQRGTDNARGACTKRRHRIEQMRNAGCALRDGLHDNGGGRLAVPDRNPHACRGQRHDKARWNAFRRQRHQRTAGSGKLAQLLQVARSRLHDPVGTVHTRALRADERAFQMQAQNAVAAGHRTRRRNRTAHLLTRIGDQSRQAGGGAVAAVRPGNRAHAVGRRLIVEQDAATAIHLQVYEAGRHENARGNARLRPIRMESRPAKRGRRCGRPGPSRRCHDASRGRQKHGPQRWRAVRRLACPGSYLPALRTVVQQIQSRLTDAEYTGHRKGPP